MATNLTIVIFIALVFSTLCNVIIISNGISYTGNEPLKSTAKIKPDIYYQAVSIVRLTLLS